MNNPLPGRPLKKVNRAVDKYKDIDFVPLKDHKNFTSKIFVDKSICKRLYTELLIWKHKSFSSVDKNVKSLNYCPKQSI